MVQVLRAVADNDSRLQRLAARLKAARLGANLTQKQLADRLGIHRVSVARVESGVIDLSFTSLIAHAEAVGISVSELLSEDVPPLPASDRSLGKRK